MLPPTGSGSGGGGGRKTYHVSRDGITPLESRPISVAEDEDSEQEEAHSVLACSEGPQSTFLTVGATSSSTTKKRKKKKKKSLFDLYHPELYEQRQQEQQQQQQQLEILRRRASTCAVSSVYEDFDEDDLMEPLVDADGLPLTTTTLSNNNNNPVYEVEPYRIGDDITVLLNLVHQNVQRSLCIDSDGVDHPSDFTFPVYQGSSSTDQAQQQQQHRLAVGGIGDLFGDAELICLAAALRHNTSLVSIQLRNLAAVTDVSLIPLCRALTSHPTMRAVDLTGTRAGRDVRTAKQRKDLSRALRDLCCQNANILHLIVDDCLLLDEDRTTVEEAVQYNAFMCSDPSMNPFDLNMIRTLSTQKRETALLEAQLAFNPVSMGLPPGALPLQVLPESHGFQDVTKRTEQEAMRQKKNAKKKHVQFQTTDRGATAASSIAAAATIGTGDLLQHKVCADYVAGKCRYGSRCRYEHPSRSIAMQQVSNLVRYEKEQKEEALRQQEASTTAAMLAQHEADLAMGSAHVVDQLDPHREDVQEQQQQHPATAWWAGEGPVPPEVAWETVPSGPFGPAQPTPPPPLARPPPPPSGEDGDDAKSRTSTTARSQKSNAKSTATTSKSTTNRPSSFTLKVDKAKSAIAARTTTTTRNGAPTVAAGSSEPTVVAATAGERAPNHHHDEDDEEGEEDDDNEGEEELPRAPHAQLSTTAAVAVGSVVFFSCICVAAIVIASSRQTSASRRVI